MERLILSKKEFEIMEALWKLNRPVSFQEILGFNPTLNRNTLLTTMRKLQRMDLVDVEGVGYNNTSLTRLFTYRLTMEQYFSQFMEDWQKTDMALSLIDQIDQPAGLMRIRDSATHKYDTGKSGQSKDEVEKLDDKEQVIYHFNKKEEK